MAGKRFRHTPYWFRMHKKYKIQDSLIPALEVTPEIISPRGKAKKPHEPDYRWLNADQKEKSIIHILCNNEQNIVTIYLQENIKSEDILN